MAQSTANAPPGQRLTKLLHHAAAIRAIVAKHGGSEPRVFGSTARKQDGSQSDVDILIRCSPNMSLFDLIHVEDELEALLGENVDVVDDSSVPHAVLEQIDREAVTL